MNKAFSISIFFFPFAELNLDFTRSTLRTNTGSEHRKNPSSGSRRSWELAHSRVL